MVVNNCRVPIFFKGEQESFLDLKLAIPGAFLLAEAYGVDENKLSKSDHKYVFYNDCVDERALNQLLPNEKWQIREMDRIHWWRKETKNVEKRHGIWTSMLRHILVRTCKTEAAETFRIGPERGELSGPIRRLLPKHKTKSKKRCYYGTFWLTKERIGSVSKI